MKTHRMQRWIRGAAVAAALLVLAGSCKKKDAVPAAEVSDEQTEPAGFGTAPSPAAFAGTFTPAEIKWGANVVPDPRVTYQDNVVVLPHGADAVRGMASNGLSWTIDATAPGADGIKTDAILFATGRVVGRVLAVERTGNELKVTLGPVEITEVIKDCDLHTNMPVDLGSMITYTAPDLPGAVGEMPKEDGSSDAGPSGRDVVSMAVISPSGEIGSAGPMAAQPPYRATRGGWNDRDRKAIRAMQASFAAYHAPALAAPNFFYDAPASITISDFTMEPYCCGGIGVKLMHKGSDATIIAYAIIHLDHPKIVFDLVIVGSTIKTAAVTLSGGAGFTVYFDAATQIGTQGNINRPFAFPSDLSIPIGGLGAPFAITFRQSMVLTTAFTAKQAIIHAEGDYGFSGALAMGLRDGAWGVDGPQSLTTKKNLLGTLGGLSLGVNGLTFAYGGKIMVGIGAFGFITGPYLKYNTAVGVVNGSSMTVASPPCKSVRFEQWLDVGVGYQMPQAVTSAINAILRLVGIREIESHGGMEHTEPLTKKYDYFPAGCDKPAE